MAVIVMTGVLCGFAHVCVLPKSQTHGESFASAVTA